MKKFTSVFLLAALVFGMQSCKKDSGPSDELKKAAVDNYAAIVYANYSDALSTAQTLKTKIDAFVANPTDAGLQEAKEAWIAARFPYGQTEVYRFYNGPIDDANGPEGLMNAWPLAEAYIDYVTGSDNAGIINDTTNYPVINKALIESLNEVGADDNISTGYHAIEFLLWGQDHSTTGPGNRPYTDYVTGGTAKNQARRGDYLKAAAELLVENLQYVTDQWAPTGSNYRNSFVNGDVNAALTKVIQGMGFLSKGELAGERLEVVYDEQSQEHEHSCFSDNTHNDMRMNILGIYNVYNGSYTRTDGTAITGTSIYDVLKAKDENVANDTKNAIQDSKDKVYLIPAPFDQQFEAGSAGRPIIKNAIDALKLQGDKLAVAAQALGYTITIE
jgi:putative iron-regulated protein